MELAIEIFNGLGALASIIGLIGTFIIKESKRNRFLYFLLAISCIGGFYCFYQYKNITDEKIRIEERRETLKQGAKKILDSSPSYISEYNPGENEGIVFSTLVLLENNKDLNPESYEIFKTEVVQKIPDSNSTLDIYQKREYLQTSANASLQILKTLAE